MTAVTRRPQAVEPLAGRRDRRIPSATGHMVGIALVFTAAGMAACAIVELLAGDGETIPLAAAATLAASAGALLWRATRAPTRVPTHSAFAAVGWTWIAISVAGALPYWWSGMLPPADALFESVSGFTGTGATVLFPIEGHGYGMLLWRQATQWLGGMGVIVLAVAVLPLLGVGGFELLRAESPGPTSDRLAPRVSETARRLWTVYLAMTVLIAAALFAAGLGLFEAVAHSMTTVATGGFSTRDASIAAFDSVVVEVVLIASMAAGAISFTIWWQVARGSIGALGRSSELRAFVTIMAAATVIVTAVLAADGLGVATALRNAGFTVVSTMSTTGFGTDDFARWPAAGQLILLALMVSGGMAGSTSGAAKLFRIQVMASHARRELRRVLHPRAVLPVKLGGHVVPEDVVGRVIGFFVLYIVLTILGIVALAVLGADLVTAAGSIVSAIGAFGPGLGETGPTSNYLSLGGGSRLVLIVYMLLGRLELFTLLLMFTAPSRALRVTLRRRNGGRARRPE